MPLRAEIVVLVGIPGSGKSTYATDELGTHTRISLDLLHTRKKEKEAIMRALGNGENIVIDNTNTTAKARGRYVEIAKELGASVRAVYFNCPVRLAITRNSRRVGKEYVPEKAVVMYHRMLQPPSVEEGFESIEEVRVTEEKLLGNEG